MVKRNVLCLACLAAFCALPARALDLEGQVVSFDGKPVAGARVYGTSYPDEANRSGWPRKAELRVAATNADGRFRLRNLRWPASHRKYERHSIVVLAEGYAIGGKEWVRRANKEASEPLTIRLAPPTTWKALVVDDKGRPVVGCPVRLESVTLNFTGKPMPREGPGDLWSAPKDPKNLRPFEWVRLDEAFASLTTARTNSKGEAAFPNAPRDGQVSVTSTHGHYATLQEWNLRTDDRKPKKLALQPGGTFTGRVVVPASGKPHPGLRVAAQGDGAYHGWGEAVTGSDGSFVVRNLPAGRYNIAVDFPPNFEFTAAAAERVEVKPGQIVKGIELRLVEGGFITGLVTDAKTDKPLPEVSIAFYGPSRPESGAWCENTTTDGEGRYRHRLPPGQNYVYYQGGLQGYPFRQPNAAARWVEVKEGQTTEVNFALEQGEEESWPPKPKPKREPKKVILRPGTYTLQWVDADDVLPGQAPSVAGKDLTCSAKPAAKLLREPNWGKASRSYTAVALGAPPRKFAVAFVESKGKGKGIDALYADTDGDGDLAEEQRTPGSLHFSRDSAGCEVGSVSFGFVRFRCQYGNATHELPVRFRGNTSTRRTWKMSFEVSGYWLGEVDTDKGKMKVALVDVAGNGRFDERCTVRGTKDKDLAGGSFLFLDPSLSGEIDFEAEDANFFSPLSEAQVLCNRLYRFSPSAMGDRLVVENYAGPTGALKVAVADCKGDPLSPIDTMAAGMPGMYATKGGEFPALPSGAYFAAVGQFTLKGANGDWQYSFDHRGRFNVPEGQSTQLEVGGRLKMRVHGKEAIACADGVCLRIKDTTKSTEWNEKGTLIFHRGQANTVLAEVADAHGASFRAYNPKLQDSRKAFSAILRNGKGKTVAATTFGFG